MSEGLSLAKLLEAKKLLDSNECKSTMYWRDGVLYGYKYVKDRVKALQEAPVEGRGMDWR